MSFSVNLHSSQPNLQITPVHTYGATVGQFSAVAESYDVARPGYPEHIVNPWLDKLGLTKASVAVELGAGTGKFTTAILRKLFPGVEDLSTIDHKNLYAVEPAYEMRVQFSKQFPKITLIGGLAEDPRIQQINKVDFVFVGTAFHWFEKESIKEIYELLKRKGRLALIWNMLDSKKGWVAECRNKLVRTGKAVNHDTFEWKELLKESNLFSVPDPKDKDAYQHDEYTLEGTESDVITCLKSFSGYAALPTDEKVRYIDEVQEILARVPRNKNGKIDIPFRVEMYICKKNSMMLVCSEEVSSVSKNQAQLIPRSASDLKRERSDADEAEPFSQKIPLSESIALPRIAAADGHLEQDHGELEDEYKGSRLKAQKIFHTFDANVATATAAAAQKSDTLSKTEESQKDTRPRAIRNLEALLAQRAAKNEQNKEKEVHVDT